MSSKRTVKQALKELKQQGYKIEPKGDKYIFYYEYSFGNMPDYEEMSARKIINMARAFSSENKQNTSQKKNLKWANKRKNRSKRKQAIHHERWDEFDSKKPYFTEDPWNHD